MSSSKRGIALLFDRPQEPVFMAKGKESAVFQVPQNYLVSFK